MSKPLTVLSVTRRQRAAANAHYCYAHALTALSLAESACNELASVLEGLRPDEIEAANISPHNLHDTASVAWSLTHFVGILDSDCPVEVSDILRAEGRAAGREAAAS